MKRLIIFVFLFALLGCTEKKKKPSPTANATSSTEHGKLGSAEVNQPGKNNRKKTVNTTNFIYIDNNNVWHNDLNCISFTCAEGPTIGVRRCEPRFVKTVGFCCPHCIDDDFYIDLQSHVGTKYFDCYELYRKFVRSNYTEFGSYDEFAEIMLNKKRRREIYNAALREGFINEGESYSDFLGRFGFWY